MLKTLTVKVVAVSTGVVLTVGGVAGAATAVAELTSTETEVVETTTTLVDDTTTTTVADSTTTTTTTVVDDTTTTTLVESTTTVPEAPIRPGKESCREAREKAGARGCSEVAHAWAESQKSKHKQKGKGKGNKGGHHAGTTIPDSDYSTTTTTTV